MSRSNPLVGVLRLVAMAAPLTGCGQSDPAPPPPLVDTAIIGPQTADASNLVLTGTVTARIESDLSFQAPGIIVARLVDRGSSVVAGQVLARLDHRDLDNAAASAQASSLAAARDAKAAMATAANAAAEERRMRGLDVAGAIAPLTYEHARNTALSTADQARSAQARAVGAAADARLAQDRAGYAVLRAPAAGAIVDVLADTGQVVQSGTPVIRLAQAGAREAEVPVPETVLAAVHDPARAILYDTGASATAELREISASADPVTRTYRARFTLSGTAAKAPLGSTVTISIGRRDAATGFVLPIGAVTDSGHGWQVDIIDPDRLTVVVVPVRILTMGSETVTVAGDLQPNQRVVRFGGLLLHGGENVRLAASNTGP